MYLITTARLDINQNPLVRALHQPISSSISHANCWPERSYQTRACAIRGDLSLVPLQNCGALIHWRHFGAKAIAGQLLSWPAIEVSNPHVVLRCRTIWCDSCQSPTDGILRALNIVAQLQIQPALGIVAEVARQT